MADVMMNKSSAGVPKTRAAARILAYARRRAGLTQRALAVASDVPQATIARIESAKQSPRFDTLAHLLRVCGFELEVEPKKGVGVDKTLINSMLAMSPAERLAFASRAGNVNDLATTNARIEEPDPEAGG
ncbi:MAG: helix-turn-helix transcriptional regulator [Candidatus Limnocylindrales bacterium]